VNDVLDYLTMTVLKRGAIAKIARDAGIPEPIHPHGRPHARTLNPESEATIADFLRVHYNRPGIGAA
jgi:hypothetical protein